MSEGPSPPTNSTTRVSSFHLRVAAHVRRILPPLLGGGVVLGANASQGGGGVGKLPEADREEVIKGSTDPPTPEPCSPSGSTR